MTLYDRTKKKVIDALLNDERTQDAIIEVINDRGVVTLLGTVESHELAELAEEIASQQEEVITVVNSLNVKHHDKTTSMS
ncbi:MAG TPA: BON domain-containing protein [Anaerolineales bacterium]|nr:BON domain-containing protein [Anaerolineales bacterium]